MKGRWRVIGWKWEVKGRLGVGGEGLVRGWTGERLVIRSGRQRVGVDGSQRVVEVELAKGRLTVSVGGSRRAVGVESVKGSWKVGVGGSRRVIGGWSAMMSKLQRRWASFSGDDNEPNWQPNRRWAMRERLREREKKNQKKRKSETKKKRKGMSSY